MMTYDTVYWFLLTYVDVCCRMLTYATVSNAGCLPYLLKHKYEKLTPPMTGIPQECWLKCDFFCEFLFRM